MAAIIFN